MWPSAETLRSPAIVFRKSRIQPDLGAWTECRDHRNAAHDEQYANYSHGNAYDVLVLRLTIIEAVAAVSGRNSPSTVEDAAAERRLRLEATGAQQQYIDELVELL